MKQHVIHLFVPMLSGLLTDSEYVAFASHLENCELCQHEHDAFVDNLDDLTMFAPPVPPPSDLRGLILSQFEGGQKYGMYTEHVAEMLGLSFDQVDQHFDRLDALEHWERGPAPGSYLYPVESPKDTFFAGFIRLEPGVIFPAHEHKGEEHLFLIAGGYTDDEGHILQSGDHDIHGADTHHTITAMEWVPCICALTIKKGFRFI